MIFSSDSDPRCPSPEWTSILPCPGSQASAWHLLPASVILCKDYCSGSERLAFPMENKVHHRGAPNPGPGLCEVNEVAAWQTADEMTIFSETAFCSTQLQTCVYKNQFNNQQCSENLSYQHTFSKLLDTAAKNKFLWGSKTFWHLTPFFTCTDERSQGEFKTRFFPQVRIYLVNNTHVAVFKVPKMLGSGARILIRLTTIDAGTNGYWAHC